MKIGYLKALKDNYIWFIQEKNNLIVIDPGESHAILKYMKDNNFILKSVLITHDHGDHIGGVKELLQYFDVPVYGMCDIASKKLNDGDSIHLSDEIQGEIIATPGHTYTSICYLLKIKDQKHLFCGDTLFAAGCGRVFTGDFQAMFNSLNKLKALDSDVFIYPGHEYTLKNLKFAHFLEPSSLLITERMQQEAEKLEKVGNTLPVTIKIEKQTNPFFRCHEPDLINSLKKAFNKNIDDELDCFIKMRELRNNF